MDDVADTVDLSAVLFREDAGERDPTVNLGWPEDEGWEYFAGLVVSEGSVCLLAESGGAVIGYLAGRLREGTSLRPGKMAELESMCVREDHKCRGIGEGLAGEFLAWAGSRGRSGRRSRRMRPTGARSASTKGAGSGPGACLWRGDRIASAAHGSAREGKLRRYCVRSKENHGGTETDRGQRGSTDSHERAARPVRRR
ncbi:MAG: GNAT family N-acetyltransferase [Rubrobacteraceae bacterium]